MVWKKKGCPFNSISKKMLQEGSHKYSRDYKGYKAVFEEIENINFNNNNKDENKNSNSGGPALGTTPN